MERAAELDIEDRAAVVHDEDAAARIGSPDPRSQERSYWHFTSGASGMKSHWVRSNESNWVRFVFSADSISARL